MPQADAFLPTAEGRWRLAALVLCSGVCLYLSVVQLSGVDFWLQAKLGEIMWSQGAIPETLLFPFTEIASAPFHAHEWLASLLFYAGLQWWGEAGMVWVTGLLGLSYFALAVRLACLRGEGHWALGLWGGMVAIATENFRHVLRPELLSLNLMAAYWIGLEQLRRQPGVRRAAVPLLLTLLWVNIHGSFILAPLMAGFYAVGLQLDHMRAARRWRCAPTPEVRALGLMAVAALLVSGINPSGWELLQFVLSFGNTEGLSQYVYEWMPSFHYTALAGFWMALLVWSGLALLLFWQRRKLSAVDLLYFVFFSVLACKAIRFPVYLGLLFAFIAPAYLAPKLRQAAARLWLYQAAVVVALLAFGSALRFGNMGSLHPNTQGLLKLSAPMVLALENPGLQGNVLTTMEMGSELIYRAYPRLRPSIDCRIDSYGMEYLGFQDTLLQDDSLLAEFVQRYDVKYMLIDRVKFRYFSQRQAWRSGEWLPVMADQSAVLLRRRDVAPIVGMASTP